MSQENVETVRRLYPGPLDYATLLSDPGAREAARAVAEAVTLPDFETVTSPGLVPLSGAEAEAHTRQIFRGFDGFVAAFGEWLSAWETWVVNPTDLVEVGEDRVLVLFSVQARSKTHGVEMPIKSAALTTLAGQRISRVELFLDQAQARKAAGLRR